VKAHLKPANAKAWALLKKLQALADQGIDGEKTSAQGKIARLTARFDFTVPEPAEAPDLFSGTFKRSTTARRVYAFDRNEYGVASSVKWAIEAATRIQCVFRDGELMAEATPATVKRLTEIAGHIACSFRALIDKFGEVDGVSANDRAVFVMGLYDGMMNETRNSGQRLPSRLGVKKRRKAKTHVSTDSPSLHIHPYTVASNLGKQIRFSAPLEEITAELEAVTRKHLAQKADQTD
jgi:hypothetical protein